jgi:tetratricopeptide (TPR) repeat protein
MLITVVVLAAQTPPKWSVGLSDGIAAIKAGHAAEAIQLLLPVAEQAKAFPSEDVRRMESMLVLAVAYQNEGQLDKAEPLYLETVQDLEARGEKSGPILAVAFDNLGRLRLEQARWREAEKCLLQARDLYAKLWTAGDLRIANVDRVLGETYLGEGRIAEGVTIVEHTVEGLRQAPEVSASTLAAGLRSLATAYTVQGRYPDAEALLDESIRLNREAGQASLEQADGLVGLGHLYLLERDTARAIPLLEKAVRIFELHNDSHLPGALGELGSAALQERKYAVARQYLQRALEINRTMFRWDQVSIAQIQASLAEAYFGERNYDKAEALIREAIVTDQNSVGKAHFTVAKLLLVEAMIEVKQRRASEADAHYRQALDIYRKTFAADHPELANAQREYLQFTKSLRK